MALHGLTALPFWLALGGVLMAWTFYLRDPTIPAAIKARFAPIYTLLENKYYMDWINEHILAPTVRLLGQGLWKGGDMGVIDGTINSSARAVAGVAALTRRLQNGYLYWYALVMIIGVVALMTWQLWPYLMGSPLGK